MVGGVTPSGSHRFESTVMLPEPCMVRVFVPADGDFLAAASTEVAIAVTPPTQRRITVPDHGPTPRR